MQEKEIERMVKEVKTMGEDIAKKKALSFEIKMGKETVTVIFLDKIKNTGKVMLAQKKRLADLLRRMEVEI